MCFYLQTPSSKYICSHSWFLHVVFAAQSVSCSKQEQITTMRNLRMLQLHHFVALYCLMVFIHGTQVSPSSGRVKTKKASVQILASCRSCVLHNLLVARSRNNFSLCVLYTNFLALYFMMVFIGKNMWSHLVAS